MVEFLLNNELRLIACSMTNDFDKGNDYYNNFYNAIRQHYFQCDFHRHLGRDRSHIEPACLPTFVGSMSHAAQRSQCYVRSFS